MRHTGRCDKAPGVRLALVILFLGGCASMPPSQASSGDTPVRAVTPEGRSVSISAKGSRIDRVDDGEAKPTQVVVEGLTDAHGHLVGLGL